MTFAIGRLSPPFNGTFLPLTILPNFFSVAIESYIYTKRIVHLVPVKIIIFKSYYNWFKINIPRLLTRNPSLP